MSQKNNRLKIITTNISKKYNIKLTEDPEKKLGFLSPKELFFASLEKKVALVS